MSPVIQLNSQHQQIRSRLLIYLLYNLMFKINKVQWHNKKNSQAIQQLQKLFQYWLGSLSMTKQQYRQLIKKEKSKYRFKYKQINKIFNNKISLNKFRTSLCHCNNQNRFQLPTTRQLFLLKSKQFSKIIKLKKQNSLKNQECPIIYNSKNK